VGEIAVEPDKTVPFMLEINLHKEGAKSVADEKWATYIQVNGKPVNGQNHASSEGAATTVFQLLKEL